MAWGTKSGDGMAAPRASGGTMSFVGGEVTINGNIAGEGDIHLDGTVEGDVRCRSLILGANGRIRGNVFADKATIAGTVEGTIDSANLVIEKSARVSGDLVYENVQIDNGAQVEGRMARRGVGESSGLKLVSADGS